MTWVSGQGSGAPGADGLAGWTAAWSEAARGLAGAFDARAAGEDAFLEALGRVGAAFFARTATPAGAGVPPAATGGLAPPLGPARAQLARAQALATATAEWTEAARAQAQLLAPAAAVAARAFAARFPPERAVPSLREALDAWIACAEAAWLDLAHGAAWCEAQARTFDRALAVRALAQEIADDAARLAGLPSRREFDELTRRVDALERALARAAAPEPRPRASPARRRRKPAP
jgi:hypothetical protein